MRQSRFIAGALVIAFVLSGCGLADARKAAIANAAVKPLDMNTSLRPGLVGLSDYPTTGWEPSELALDAEPGPTTSAQAALAAIGLQSADVAESMQISTIPDGAGLLAPTLDFCDGNYPSEALRIDRLQRAAYDADGNFVGISSEIVVYRNATAAKQALAEVIKVRKNCPTKSAFSTRDGHELAFAFHSAPGPSSTPLVDANSRLVVHTTMVVDGEDRRAFLVYQILGRVLAALYVSEAGSKPFDQTSLDSFYLLAGDMADRLRAAPQDLLYGDSLTNA